MQAPQPPRDMTAGGTTRNTECSRRHFRRTSHPTSTPAPGTETPEVRKKHTREYLLAKFLEKHPQISERFARFVERQGAKAEH